MGGVEPVREVGTGQEPPCVQNNFVVNGLLFASLVDGDVSQNSETELLDAGLEGS